MERDLVLPSGFRFHPTDDELVHDYLVRKCRGLPLPSSVIAGIDLYKYNPWQLPGMATYGEKEWYFFSPRDRKYPNGKRPNRAAGNGYWKATGADRPIGRPRTVAIKKSLVFYAGRQQDGIKTNWIMHEYRLANVDRSSKGKKNKLRLDEWVLCRLYNKKGYIEKYTLTEQSDLESSQEVEEENPEVSLEIGLQLYPKPSNNWPGNSEAHVVETLGSVHKLHPESSSSVHMNSPEFNAADKEVQSEPKRDDLERDLEKGFDYSMLGFMGDADFFGAQSHLQMSQFYPHTQLQMNQFPPLPQQDLFSFPYPNTQQKPF